jgi:hypothetical protein
MKNLLTYFHGAVFFTLGCWVMYRNTELLTTTEWHRIFFIFIGLVMAVYGLNKIDKAIL